ncbi:nuclease-related domain-containing protein [Oscillospiraceae bacterium LTW-04]|nr:nuclease-related domain-containing protein [Oscillospiraceae bacterium MB24-C1]
MSVFLLLIKTKTKNNSVAALLSTLPKEDYTVLNDIMIKSYTGFSHIDHIVISAHGIFVIETQNYHGNIVGKDTDQYWTWSTGNEKHRFFNPIRQNHSHIKALESTLEPVGKVPLISVVAFPRDCELKSKPPGVLHYNELLAKIQSYTKNVLTRAQIEFIIATLERANIENPEIRKQHAG